MLLKRSDLPFWISVGATALLTLMPPPWRDHQKSRIRELDDKPPFGEPRSSDEPRAIELRRARERGRGRHATHPLQIPWRGWMDILWRTYQEMQSDRLLSIAGGVAFFVLLAIFPAITALVSAYGLFFNTSTITGNLALLNDVVPANVLGIVSEQANRIAANSGRALSVGIVVGMLVSLWSAMSGVKAMIDALNVIYEQQEGRSFIKLNLEALIFTLGGFAAFLLAIAAIIVLPLVLSPIGLGSQTETLTRVLRWPALLLVLLTGLAVLYRYGPVSSRGALAVGQRRQRFCGGHLDRRVVSVLVVSRELCQLQRHVRLVRRGGRPDGVAVDFDHRGSAGRRVERRDRAPDSARLDRGRRKAARRARRGDGRHRRRRPDQSGLNPVRSSPANAGGDHSIQAGRLIGKCPGSSNL